MNSNSGQPLKGWLASKTASMPTSNPTNPQPSQTASLTFLTVLRYLKVKTKQLASHPESTGRV
jgi:hypothetical protein